MKSANCPACLLKLQIDDELIDCPCCDSLLRLAQWKPPAFEVVRWGDVLETAAEKEDRIRYDEEMAKITYREPDGGNTGVIEIDISAPSRALGLIRLVDYLLVISCSLTLVQLIAFHVLVPKFRTGPLLPVYLSIETVLFLGVAAGYRHAGVIDERAWNNYRFILPPLLILFILELIVLFLLTTEVVAPDIYVYDALYLYLCVLLTGAGLVTVLRLRKMGLLPLRLSLVELSSELRNRGQPLPRLSKSARRLNAPLGTLTAAAGIVIILGCVLFPLLVMNSSEVMTSIVFSLPQMPGWILLMRSRRYFQVHADSLLSVDKREHILFLRPFSDDQKLRLLTLPINLLRSFLDFSLEVRLSNHFSRFGPFIAVGVPGETAPVRGAARVVLAHHEWLPKVADWITNANIIVMYAGSTNWVSWELAKIIETGSFLKLILIIPQVRGDGRGVRAENVSMRIERLSRVLKDTKWSNSFAKLRNVEDVRAMLLRDDGSLVVVRSRPHNRDSYHLAAMIAHYIMLDKAGPSSLLNGAEDA